MADNEQQNKAQGLRRDLFGLAHAEREIRREIGARVLAGEPVIDLCALRLANREQQENLAAAVGLLEASTP